MSANYHMEQKTSMVASCTSKHTYPRESFLQLLLLKVCESFVFRQSKKTYKVLWLAWVFLGFKEKRRPINIVFEKLSNFSKCR